MATWLHDDDTIRYLAEENGDIRDWARFHALARGMSDARPTHPLYSPVAALMGNQPLAAWGARALQETRALPEFLLLQRAGRLDPDPADPWAEPLAAALPTPYGPHAADLLVRLGLLGPRHLAPLAARHPDASTWFAWLVSAAPLDTIEAELRPRIAADLASGGTGCIASLALLTNDAPPLKTAEDAIRRGCERAGVAVPTMGPGSTHNRARTAVRALASRLQPSTRWLVDQVVDAPSPVPPSIAYGVATASGDRPIVLTSRDDPAYPLFHAADCAATPDLLTETLQTDRSLGLRVARFVPTEQTLEHLLAMPIPADPDERVDLALALAMMATPTASTSIRGVLEHVSSGDSTFVRGVYAGLVGTAL